MRGPTRKPAEKDLKLGNPSKRNRRALEAAAAPSQADTTHTDAAPSHAIIAAPSYLTPGVREVWDAYIATAIGQSIVKSGDLPALERYCTYVWEWRIHTAALHDKRRKSGLRTTETVKRERYGEVTKVRVEFQLRAQLEDKIRALEIQFGATPSARAAVMGKLAEIRDASRPPMAQAPGASKATPATHSAPP
ncbi:MAG: P27 family phage terminase small subunit, partial [Hyphomicrobiaceae bacterium]